MNGMKRLLAGWLLLARLLGQKLARLVGCLAGSGRLMGALSLLRLGQRH